MGKRNQLGELLENSKLRKPKVKRGGKKYKNQSLVLFSANAEGLKPKIESLKNELNDLNVAVFTIQETHHTKKGMLKLEKYEIFEAIRMKHCHFTDKLKHKQNNYNLGSKVYQIISMLN